MSITTPVTAQFNTVQTPDAVQMAPSLLPSPAQMTAAQTGPAAQTATAQIDPNALNTPTAVTSEDRIAGILSRGGPLMQQAATAGTQQAASRGLLNSSMAVQAAQGAVIQAAAPIGTNDANSLNQMAVQNANTQNSATQFNANATNSANQFNAQATNQNAQFNTSNQQQANTQNTSAINTASQFNANTQNQANQFNAQSTNDFAKLNTQNQNTANQWNAQQTNEAILKTMDVNSREQLANIEANYKQLMQTNSSAENIYSQVMKNISDIQNNKDIADKTTAIESQMGWLRSGLTMIQNLNGVTGLVTF